VRSVKGDGGIGIENASAEDFAEFDPPARESTTVATFKRHGDTSRATRTPTFL
jgi:hypothetical protein